MPYLTLRQLKLPRNVGYQTLVRSTFGGLGMPIMWRTPKEATWTIRPVLEIRSTVGGMGMVVIQRIPIQEGASRPAGHQPSVSLFVMRSLLGRRFGRCWTPQISNRVALWALCVALGFGPLLFQREPWSNLLTYSLL